MKKFMKTVLLAIKYREESYNQAEADHALKEAVKKAHEINLENLKNGKEVTFEEVLKMVEVDFSQFYVLSLEESADRAANDMGYENYEIVELITQVLKK